MHNTESINIEKPFACAKCGNTTCESSIVSATGGILTKIVNVQKNKFIARSCLACGYTELYKTRTPGIENIADLFLGR